MRRFWTRANEERGIALITAIMVVAVLVTIGITSVGLAMHNTQQSGRDRSRVQGIAAAEAGVDYYFSHLQSSTVDQFQCSISKNLTVDPGVKFDATATYYDANGAELPCPVTSTPKSALIRSEGNTTAGNAPRMMEAYVHLVPIRGAPIGETAIYSEGTPGFNSNVDVFGSLSQDGNVYTNGSLIIDSNSRIHGNVYVQGNVVIRSNSEIKRTVWAKGSATLQTQSRVLEDIISSTSWILLESNSDVFRDARAGTTITLQGNSRVMGLKIPNTPSEPPPVRSFPQFTYEPDAWIAEGYTIHNFSDCGAARTFINGITGGKRVVRITSGCSLEWGSNTSATVQADLAIISNGSLRMNSNSAFLNGGGSHKLYLVFGLGGVPPCNIQFDSNTSVAAGLRTLLYTPCGVNLNSNSLVIEGQIFGGSVTFNANTTMNYTPLDVPGQSSGRFKEDIVYIREVVAGS